MRSLVACGVWEQLLARTGDAECAADCMRRLQAMELAEFRDAIVGRSYQSIWSRADAQHKGEE